MSRFLPHPLLSLGLVFVWLLLTRFSLGHLILGTVIAGFAGWAFARIEPDRPRIRAYLPLVRLALVVGLDIIRSNWAVALLMLTNGRHGARNSAFVEIPLRLRDPVGLSLLAMIVTATPGTAWLEYDAETGVLLLHVFDMIETDDWPALICGRYEARLLEAFEE
ncbi:Na+/H+ antiporter subunit E [Rhodobacter sp. SGA-6-6]|uniref:Na+/H+ antiporter subunit E n=1 Tax=Rhodobacter sp. SGA-6-6 TaxID=2710882 RepID=UPI0013ED46BF|nr:Na+/H+ antiporter subunit E [Rhodobacter sp. SGA-6-6]NGM46187.1 Na+/H+ antiporter subunit E [Rhodobacter sp. SGA-6-6]